MGKAELPLHAPGTQLDRGYIGQSVPRPNAARLLQGRGAFTDDLRFPRLAHVAFFRSPYAHARIKKLDFEKARRQPGVIGVFDGRAVAEYCTPWVAVLAHLKGIKSPPQHAIAIERACWQGEAVAAVVAESRSQAEDAVQLIEADWEELPVVVDMEEALAGKRVIHPDFSDNICFKREHDTGGVDEVFAKADVVVEDTFHFGRHTGVCPEGRAILADYNAGEHSLTVYHATQAPHMMQDIFSRHLNIPEANVRVIAKDIGGSYGIKVHVYPDEMATAALSVMLRRPVKFVADRLESFLSDIHCREHRAKVRLACYQGGRDPGVRARRPDRDRPVLGLPAHQRHRGQPGGEPHRRPVQAPEVQGAHARGVHQQERHLPVPRRRPSDRGGAHRRHRRPRRAEARHGSGRVPAQEPDRGRRLSRTRSRRASSSRSSRTTRRWICF